MTRVISGPLEVVGALTADASLDVGTTLNVVGAADVGGGLDVVQPTLGNAVETLTSTATNDDVIETVIQARVTTTNNTTTNLLVVTIPANTTLFMDVTITCRRTGGVAGTAEDGGAFVYRVAWNNIAGVATLIPPGGALTSAGRNNGAISPTVDASGATGRLRVTGDTNNNYTWHATARIYKVSS